ncbi:MAG: DUF6114 domain-containing protein [Aigarchaeota archaeon]|nr:DUF6114 domain-containing protein [Candidatus Pelearchaeum maunauluense]
MEAGEKPVEAFVPSLLAGLMIIIGAILRILLWLTGYPIWSILLPPNLGGLIWGFAIKIMGFWLFMMLITSLLFGLVIMSSALILYNKPEQARTWGNVVLLASIISILIPGGFFAGSVLGIMGGLLAITWRRLKT